MRKLCGLFHHPKSAVCSQSLAIVMSLIKTAWQEAGAKPEWGQLEKQLLQSVVLSLCSTKRPTQAAVNRLQEFLVFADVKFWALKHLKKTISTAVAGQKVNNVFIDNILSLLEVVDMKGLEADPVTSFLCR